MQPTEQMITDTEVALSHWWCGTDFRDIDEDLDVQDEPSFTDDAIVGALMFEQHDVDTLKLLTLWRGYLHASKGEGTEASVEDFILATYIVNKEEHDEDRD